MIEGLKPYPAMKDSGVPWLGEVPAHWVVRKLKYAVSFSGGGTPSKADASFWGGRIPWVSPKDMTRARITDSLDHITEEAVSASAASIISPGALLMVVRSGILRRTIPVAINAAAVALNQDMKALRPRAGVVASEYLRALVQGNEGLLIQEWTKQGATVESIEHEFLANSLIPLPPLPEQAAIVRFLDHADRRIRRYIRAKQKLIKLLGEQKQAIIHRAVTRGLDPNVRLKPSGVEWLGDVPEHWEVVRLKNVASHIVDCLHATPAYTERGQFPAIRTADITPGAVHLRTARRVDDETYERWTQRLEPAAGDILYSREGERFGIAACVPPDTRLCISQRMMLFRIRPAHNSSFVMWVLNSPQTYAQATQDVMGSTAPHVNVSTIRNFALALPSFDEQCQIAEYIESVTPALREATEGHL